MGSPEKRSSAFSPKHGLGDHISLPGFSTFGGVSTVSNSPTQQTARVSLMVGETSFALSRSARLSHISQLGDELVSLAQGQTRQSSSLHATIDEQGLNETFVDMFGANGARRPTHTPRDPCVIS